MCAILFSAGICQKQHCCLVCSWHHKHDQFHNHAAARAVSVFVCTQRTDQFGSFSEMAMNGCCQPDSRYSRCCLRQTHMPCDMAASTDPQILALSF